MKYIYYHGGPMWGGKDCFNALYKDSCALVSYARPEQLKNIIKVSKSVVLDNGAFSAWRKSKKSGKVVNWEDYWTQYYCFVFKWITYIDWFIIPDVIEGTEEENNRLINRVPHILLKKAVPVWHSTESLDRLVMLCKRFNRVAIGLCGIHSKAISKVAQLRLQEAFELIYTKENLKTKIHGLRMLNGRVLGKFPLSSGDSCFVALNVPKTKSQMKHEQRKLNRTAIYKAKIEMVIPPTISEWKVKQIKNKSHFTG